MPNDMRHKNRSFIACKRELTQINGIQMSKIANNCTKVKQPRFKLTLRGDGPASCQVNFVPYKDRRSRS